MSAQRARSLTIRSGGGVHQGRARAIVRRNQVQISVARGRCEVNTPRRRGGIGRSSRRGGCRSGRAAAFRTGRTTARLGRKRDARRRSVNRGEWARPRPEGVCLGGTLGREEALSGVEWWAGGGRRSRPGDRWDLAKWMLHCVRVLFYFRHSAIVDCNYCQHRWIRWEIFNFAHPTSLPAPRVVYNTCHFCWYHVIVHWVSLSIYQEICVISRLLFSLKKNSSGPHLLP